MVDIAQITQYFNIGLLVLFILIALGLFLAGLRGFRRGVWKSTHNMIFMLSLVLIAFFTLNVLTDFIGGFDISLFFKGSLYLSREIDGSTVTYYVPFTSVKETLTQLIQGFYTLYNVSASASSAANFALALTGSVLKIILFVVEMLLIVTFGNFFSFITWYLIFQHFIPRVARKLVKLRWVGMLETAVTFIVVLFLFMTPFTSLVNSINQSYQRNRPKSDNEIVMNIGNFVDAYNNSLFAMILFNWTVDDSGMTLDTRLFDTLTTSVSGDYSIGLIGEFANLTNVIVSAGNALSSSGDSEYAFDPTSLITQEVADLAFDSIINSDIITSIIPVVVEIAMNSDMLAEYIPNRLVDLSDVDWKNEIGYVKDMVDCIFESGAVDNIFVTDEQGHKTIRSFSGDDLFDFFNDLVYSEDFNRILDIFKAIDQSKVLSRTVPAILQYLISADKEGNVAKYLPLSWEELNELSWGFETYILLDFLHSTIKLDDDFLKAIFIKAGAYHEKEGEHIKALQTLISEHIDGFRALLVGEFNDAGELINVDKFGQTEVFNQGQRIVDENGKERNYCLFDMRLVGRIMPSLLEGLFDADFFKDLKGNMSEDDLKPFRDAVKALNTGTRLVNYKKEFNAVLDVITTVAKDEELLDALMSGNGLNPLMKEEGNLFSIDQVHVNYFQSAISKMDRSTILYGILAPTLKSLLLGDDVKATLNDMGLKSEVMASAIEHDIKRANHTLFTDFSSLLDAWPNLNTVYSLTSTSGDSDGLMGQLKNRDTVDAFVDILKVLHNNQIINPDPEEGDTYEKNENLYGILEFVFSMTSSMGLTVTRDTLREVEHPGHTWDDEFEAFGDIIYFIANKDLMNASDAFSGGLTRSALWKLKESGEGNYDIPGLFDQIDRSYIFSTTLGPFLDDMFGDSLDGFLIDKENHISFGNITNWDKEGDNIKALLDSLYDIVPENDEEAKDFLSNFNLKSISDVVKLNELLHNLASSGIFTYIDENDVSHFQFGKWLYGKIDSSMSSFQVGEEPIDLLGDPEFDGSSAYKMEDTWDVWGTRPEDDLLNADPYFMEWKEKYNPTGTKENTHYIAYRDFVYPNGMADDDPNLPAFWCDNENFATAQATFLLDHEDDLTGAYVADNNWKAYYASEAFITDYEPVFAVDEVSRITRFLCYAMRAINADKDGNTMDFSSIDSAFLKDLLYAINDTTCMRISLYNFYRIAASDVLGSYSGFSLSSAYNAYMVDAGASMYNHELGKTNRAKELDKLISFYELIEKAKDKGVIDGGNFNYENMNKDGFMDDMEAAVKELNNSYVFHRKGSSKNGELTTFQGLLNTMLGESEIKTVVYLEHSPKDQAATTYDSAASKVRVLIADVFRDDNGINEYISENPGSTFAARRAAQETEIHTLLSSINKIYTLKDSEGHAVSSISAADMKNPDNSEAIHQLLLDLNASDLLYDLVPNTIYNLFIENNMFSISAGGNSVDFQRVDPFYHYYYNVSLVKRSSVDFTARYDAKDIDGINYLLEDYQEYNEVVGTGSVTNRTTLRALTGTETDDVFEANGVLPRLLKHLHGCNIFHTPARDGAYAIYYTDKFNDNGFTLFEEMMSKVCSFVKLDTFAYDSSYAADIAYGSAANKMRAKIKEVTAADDGQASTAYYHNEQGHAWDEEINAIMHLAYTSAGIGSGDDLDTTSLDLSTLPPETMKKMLKILNSCDIASDALANFVKDGFEAIHLGSQTTYNSVNYAYYRLGQEVYGGSDGDAPAGTEIDNIYNIMVALAEYDKTDPYHPVFTGYMSNMNNLNTFIKGSGGSGGADGLKGLMKYIYDSHIFNTSLAGNYDEYNIVDGRKISAQGVLLYNSLGTNLNTYVARTVDDPRDLVTPPAKEAVDKIASLSKIVHMRQYGASTSNIESAGLKRLINLTDGNINATTFGNTSDINTVKSKKAFILGIVEAAYNATNEAEEENYKRSVIVSEFISGVFNSILENQFKKLTTTYPTYEYELFAFGNDDAATLTFADYASLDKVERDGLQGILDNLDYISGGSPVLIAANMKANAAQLEANFALMGQTPTTNSEIARVIYLSEAHKTFKDIAAAPIVDSHLEHFVPVDETTTDPTYLEPYNIYSNGFSFKWYGEHIHAFIGDVTLP